MSEHDELGSYMGWAVSTRTDYKQSVIKKALNGKKYYFFIYSRQTRTKLREWRVLHKKVRSDAAADILSQKRFTWSWNIHSNMILSEHVFILSTCYVSSFLIIHFISLLCRLMQHFTNAHGRNATLFVGPLKILKTMSAKHILGKF